MRYVIALFFPWIAFFTIGRPFAAIVCLILQVTLIGWLPATLWAFVAIAGHSADKRTDRIVEAVQGREGDKQNSTMAIWIGVGAVLFVLGAIGWGALSFNGGGTSEMKVGADTACAAAAPRAEALGPLVGGEIAAFQIARAPEKLSALGFAGEDGAPMTLAAFEGKVALVNLWATWCAPCRKEMPALDRLQVTLGGDDFSVVPISIDTAEPQRSAAFLASVGVKNLPLYTDRTTEIFEDLKARSLAVGLPVTVLLDRTGCRLGHMNGPAEWDSEDGRRLIEAAIGMTPAVES